MSGARRVQLDDAVRGRPGTTGSRPRSYHAAGRADTRADRFAGRGGSLPNV